MIQSCLHFKKDKEILVMAKVLIVTGPGGDAQGWGDMKVTKVMCETLHSGGRSAEIAYVESMDGFMNAINNKSYDIVWSALYYISQREDIIGISGDVDWVADILDERGIPYIGPDAPTMKQLIQKYETHRIMHEHGALVPKHYLVDIGDGIPDIPFPAFVKPNCESRSIGITDESVVHTRPELENRIQYVHEKLEQAALVEEYLPGQEYTVLMLGNGRLQEILPGFVSVDPSHFGKYQILRSDLRGVGLTKISIPETRFEESKELCKRATDALNCLDHVRVDMRVGADDHLRVIEINGIPGLKPVKSWSPQIYSLYHPSGKGHMEEYGEMLHLIVSSALERHGIH
jgi:D-alanine-D-alanine ligase